MTAVELYEWAASEGGPAPSTTLAYQLAEAIAKDMTVAAEHWKAKYEGLS